MLEGRQMYNLIERLFKICRSITGEGVRETLMILKEHLPNLNIQEIPSGTKCYDWIVPEEWNIKDAYISDQDGNKIVDFKKNNLHVVGYSIPINQEMSLDDLQKNLFSLPEKPEAIPYVTSYFQRLWGFCISHNQRKNLTDQRYRVFIDSELKPGSLTYADFMIPGKTDKEIFISTYTCHPSLANNELSGPALSTILGKYLTSRENYYSYRFVFAPETIGPLVYLSQHRNKLKENTIAAFNLSCVGDNRSVSFLPSRQGNSLTDRIARHILRHKVPEYKEYSYLKDRGSDERQYCSPGTDLPMVSIMRSKYGNSPEYHTSLDNLSVVSIEGLQKSFDLHSECFVLIEKNKTFQSTSIGEPHLARRGLINKLGGGLNSSPKRKMIQDFLSCADGKNDLINIADQIGIYALDLLLIVETLLEMDLIKETIE